MEKTRILLIIPNLGMGGAQRVFHQQLALLSPHFNVQGCVFNWDGALDEDKTNGILSLEVPAGRTWIRKISYFVLRVIRLRKIKRQMNIQVSISHLEGADYINLFSSGSDKVICWIHGTKKFDRNIKGILGLIRKYILMPLIYRRVDKIVTVSKGIKDELKNTFKDVDTLLDTVYNGFDVELIQKLASDSVDAAFLQMSNTSEIIITHGRLSRQKNLRALIGIFEAYRKSVGSKLVIIGDGELRQELLDECQKLGLKTWSCWKKMPWDDLHEVYFLGQQQNPFKYLKHASLYVMTSAWEGFPLALCEAMVCRLPVMATDCYTGPKEILAPEISLSELVTVPYYANFGLLMPLADASNTTVMKIWCEALMDMLRDKHRLKRYSEVGINRICDFDLKLIINETVEVINDVNH